MPTHRLHSAALILLCSPAAAWADSDEQLWLTAVAQGSVADDIVYFAELQPRFGDGISDLDQLIARGAAGWRLSDALAVYQGYAYVESPRPGAEAVREDRSFQQISWNMGDVGGGELSSRTRLEQRWRSDGSDTGWRIRSQLRYELPLEERPQPLSALGWVEGFFALNDTDWGAQGGFDQVRAFAGLELPLSGASTVEAGYLNQTIDAPAGGTTVNHVLSVTLQLRH